VRRVSRASAPPPPGGDGDPVAGPGAPLTGPRGAAAHKDI